MTDLDRTDRKILDILQRQGRISITELAQKVGLSDSPCTERVRRLEREPVITGYHARIDPAPRQETAGVRRDKMASKSDEVFERVKQEMLHVPEVLECHLVSGGFDYLVKARLARCGSTAACWATC